MVEHTCSKCGHIEDLQLAVEIEHICTQYWRSSMSATGFEYCNGVMQPREEDALHDTYTRTGVNNLEVHRPSGNYYAEDGSAFITVTRK